MEEPLHRSVWGAYLLLYTAFTFACVLIELQEPSNHSLKEFLIENEGKRCVVVLDVRVVGHD